ncbi:MAG: hypothetical protein ACKVQS_13670 [Fimbriimonadaceae bacterium]
MQLLTDWTGFLAELQNRWPDGATIYLARDGRYTTLTTIDQNDNILFRCKHVIPMEEAITKLTEIGHTCRNGVWSTESDHQSLDELYIAAVAYRTEHKEPGLWVDVYNSHPSPSKVLTKLLDEFNADGTLSEADNETFQKFAHPNIVILTPEQIQGFLGQNQAQSTINEHDPESERTV